MSKKLLVQYEYPVKCSPKILFDFLSTPAGLRTWFAEKCDENSSNRKDLFIFTWNGSIDKAVVEHWLPERYIRFHWWGSPIDEYFEFRIRTSEITKQVTFVIIDFADKADVAGHRRLWDFQVKGLMKTIGNEYLT